MVKPKYQSNSDCILKSSIEAMFDAPLQAALSASLFKIVPFDRSIPNWTPDRLLTIKPLHEFVPDLLTLNFGRGRRLRMTWHSNEYEKQQFRGKQPGGRLQLASKTLQIARA